MKLTHLGVPNADTIPTKIGFALRFSPHKSEIIRVAVTQRGIRTDTEERFDWKYFPPSTPVFDTAAEAAAALPKFHTENYAGWQAAIDASVEQAIQREADCDHEWRVLSHEEFECRNCGAIRFCLDE